ncbi:MAG: hypothetical protein D6772_15080 [Bacteroidetes bacterium]|nr:MAG: hypothetical protein D6772_15080 [Bacteroidota bacterium]
MAKKRFTDGLNSLFGEEENPTPQKELTLFPQEERGVARRDEEKRSSKGFASQLDAFLAEAFEAEAEAREDSPTEKRSHGTKARRLSGLDMLIRQTTDAPPAAGPKTSDRRRLTLAFDKAQLARLKEIAKAEGMYLKDLIKQLIERYLAEHQN